MEQIRATWSALSLRQRAISILAPAMAVVILAVAVGGALGRPRDDGPPVAANPPAATPTATLPPLPPEDSPAPGGSLEPIPSTEPPPPGADPLLGTDGRLTVLLLGSDYRPAHPGNRTDAIMVVSLDPTTRLAAAFSIPRDTSNFPIGNGKRFGAKVNGLYQHLQTTTGNGGRAMEVAISKAFGIEVDGYVLIGFAGVRQLIGAVGGVDVHLDQAYYDPDYWVTSTKRGWGLPKGTSHLGPADALIFARSRHGDNDFNRARRQQQLVLAALVKVRSRDVTKLPRLIALARDTVRTDLPLDRARDLYDLVSTTDISRVERVVFGPRTYASSTGGTTFELKLDECRRWIKAHFPAVRPMGQWPEPSPSTAIGGAASPAP
jgi:LCP family protein required for cell wall assembly